MEKVKKEKKVQHNITIALSLEEDAKLQELVEYFDKGSIKKVKRSDVVRYLIQRYHYIMESGTMEESFTAVEEIIERAKSEKR